MSKKGERVSSGYWNVCTDINESTGEKTFQTYSLYSKAADRETDDGSNLQVLKDGLEINNDKFIFDHQYGLYGYNTDSSKGADTFCSFGMNQIKIDFSGERYKNIGDQGFDEYLNYITFPISIIDSIEIEMTSFDKDITTDGNKKSYYHIYVDQYGENTTRLKTVSYNLNTRMRYAVVTSDEFENIEEYPYLKISSELYTDRIGRLKGECILTINLK